MTYLELSRYLTAIASLGIIYGLWAQMFRTIKTRSVKDLTLSIVFVELVNELAWSVFATQTDEWPIKFIAWANLPAAALWAYGYYKYSNETPTYWKAFLTKSVIGLSVLLIAAIAFGHHLVVNNEPNPFLQVCRAVCSVTSLCIASGLFDLAFKGFRTKSNKDIDPGLVIAVMVNEIAWANYTVQTNEWPLWIITCVNLPAAITLCYSYLKHREKRQSQNTVTT